MNITKVVLLTAVCLLSACDKPAPIGSPELEVASRQLVPQDPEIAAIYARSCANCHTVAATLAPLTGDTVAWAPRMGKGINVLVNSVINGFGGMPPFGLCMDCDARQFEALIRFMASPEAAP